MIEPCLRCFFWGATALGSFAIALGFLRYNRLTSDRLFAYFALAFLCMGLNWTGLALVDPGVESRHMLYLFRLAAFVLVIGGIIDKNRRYERE